MVNRLPKFHEYVGSIFVFLSWDVAYLQKKELNIIYYEPLLIAWIASPEGSRYFWKFSFHSLAEDVEHAIDFPVYNTVFLASFCGKNCLNIFLYQYASSVVGVFKCGV